MSLRMPSKEFFTSIYLLFLGIVFAFLSGYCLYIFGPEIFQQLFPETIVCSVPELINVRNTVAAEVSGIVDVHKILAENTENRRSGKIREQNYYYAFMNENRTAGFYVYSELAPEEFIKRYAPSRVTLRGMWEEMPRNVRMQDPMSRTSDQIMILKKHMKSGDKDSLFKALGDYHQAHPIMTTRRLNLQPKIFKLVKAIGGLFLIIMFFVSISMVWTTISQLTAAKEVEG